jgi:hypothetical protein
MEEKEKELLIISCRRADSWRLGNYLLLMDSAEKETK